MNIKNLKVYNTTHKDMYRGISRSYFPKWAGWEVLDNNGSLEEVDKAVEGFYLTYYFYYLKVDILKDSLLEFCIMNFATIHGKRKAIMKLEKASGLPITGKPSTFLMEYVHDKKETIIPMFLLELLEFYEFIGDISSGLWVLGVYREFNSEGKNE